MSECGDTIMGMSPLEFERWRESMKSQEEIREGLITKYFKTY